MIVSPPTSQNWENLNPALATSSNLFFPLSLLVFCSGLFGGTIWFEVFSSWISSLRAPPAIPSCLRGRALTPSPMSRLRSRRRKASLLISSCCLSITSSWRRGRIWWTAIFKMNRLCTRSMAWLIIGPVSFPSSWTM